MKKADEFHAAVARGDAVGARALLHAGVSVDVRNKDALPALYIASENADVEMMRVLLDAGADVRCVSVKRPYAPSSGTGKPARRGIAHTTALTVACAGFSDGDIPVSRREKAISLLLEHGAAKRPSNEVDKDELYRAADALLAYALTNSGEKWDTQVVSILNRMVQAGLDVTHDAGADWTLMHAAIHRGAGNKVLQALLDLGAGATAARSDGIQPVHLAAARYDAAAFRLLVAHGADVNAPDGGGRTPLYHVQSLAMCETLIEMGADVHHKNAAGETPAAYFVIWGANDAASGEVSMPELVVEAIVNAGGGFGSGKAELNRVAKVAKSKEFVAVSKLVEVLRAHDAISSVINRARQPRRK